MSATQKLGTGRSSTFVDSPLSGLEALANGGGSFSTASGAFVVIPGTLINFTLAVSKTIFLMGFATAEPDGVFNVPDAQLGVRVDGTDYPGNCASFNNAATFLYAAIMVAKQITLGPGAHSAQLVLRKPGLSPATAAIVFTAPTIPTSLSMIS